MSGENTRTPRAAGCYEMGLWVAIVMEMCDVLPDSSQSRVGVYVEDNQSTRTHEDVQEEVCA